MAAPLDEHTAFRVAKLLGKLSSVHDGEALSAARMAHRLVMNAGVTWDDLVLNGKPPRPKPIGLVAEILFCLEHDHILSEWERNFLCSILSWAQTGGSLSYKQKNAFDRIKAKVEVVA